MMIQVFVFLHVLGAVLMGFYLMLPFLSARIGALGSQSQAGYVTVLFTANRVGQMMLAVELLSGGYLFSKVGYSIPWVIITLVLFLALGGLTGVLGKQMRLGLADDSGKEMKSKLGKIKMFSNLCGVLYLAIIVMMTFPF
jgi:hypothetical protein